jgi:tetratricopeptide (TPR) repeat protein
LNHIEPTYLRFVYDKLEKGILNSENPSSLPDGFVGIYEQEFMANTSVDQRQNTLLKFGLWSLFKSAVSIETFSLVFNVQQSEIRVFIDSYSNWFNSPEPGRYQLYHDRIKVFFLQKLKNYELQELNERLISSLLKSIKAKNGDSTEKYALEHLSTHMALESMMGHEYERLHQFVNNESIWTRQIDISNGYEWSQKAIQHGIKEGARRQDELNTLRSTVNSVKLMQQEQNSAEDILRLLNRGDYQTALGRAERWEGDRQFKLYLLMIHDLTLGDCKDASFKIKALEVIIQAIDDTPIDHTILDWSNFYPEIAVFKYIYELHEIGIDGSLIWKRNNGQLSLIDVLNSYSTELDELITFACSEFGYKIFLNQGDQTSVISELIKICEILLQKRHLDKLDQLLSITVNRTSNLEDDRSYSYGEIVSFLKNTISEYENSLNDNFHRKVVKIARKYISELLNVKGENNQLLSDLSNFYMSDGNKEKALNLINKIEDDYIKDCALSSISIKLINLDFKNESLKIAHKIIDLDEKDVAIGQISNKIATQGDVDEALSLLKHIKSSKEKEQTIESIIELKFEKVSVHGTHNFIKNFVNQEDKNIALSILSNLLINNDSLNETLKILDEIEDVKERDRRYQQISNLYYTKGEKNEALKIAHKIIGLDKKAWALSSIAEEMAYEGSINEAIKILGEIKKINPPAAGDVMKAIISSVIEDVEFTLDKQIESNLFDKAFKIIDELKSDFNTDDVLSLMSLSIMKKSPIEYGERAINIVNEIKSRRVRNSLLSELSFIQGERGCINDAFELINKIDSCEDHIYAFENILECHLDGIKSINSIPEINNNESLIVQNNQERDDIDKELEAIFHELENDPDIGDPETLEEELNEWRFNRELENFQKHPDYNTCKDIKNKNLTDIVLNIGLLLLQRNIRDIKHDDLKNIYELFIKNKMYKESFVYLKKSLSISNTYNTINLNDVDFFDYEYHEDNFLSNLIELKKFKELKDYIFRLDHLPTKDSINSKVSEILYLKGENKEGSRYLNNINDQDLKDEILGSISSIICEQGDKVEALKLIDQIQDESTVNLAYTEVAKILAARGQIDEALEMVNHISRDFGADENALMEISKILAADGQKHEALKILNQIQDKDLALAEISVILMTKGERNTAIKLLDEINDPAYKNESIVSISKVLTSDGQKDAALKIVNKIQDKYDKAIALEGISEILIEKGLNNQALEITNKIYDEGKREKSLSNISKSLLDEGLEDEAIIIYNQLSDNSIKDIVLMKLSEIYILKGSLDLSLKIIDDIQNIYTKDSTLNYICGYLIKKRDIKKWSEILINYNSNGNRRAACYNYGLVAKHEDWKKTADILKDLNDKEAFIFGLSRQIKYHPKQGQNIFPYLYNFSNLSYGLSNLLISEAKNIYVEGFDSNKEKLKILREVVAI